MRISLLLTTITSAILMTTPVLGQRSTSVWPIVVTRQTTTYDARGQARSRITIAARNPRHRVVVPPSKVTIDYPGTINRFAPAGVNGSDIATRHFDPRPEDRRLNEIITNRQYTIAAINFMPNDSPPRDWNEAYILISTATQGIKVIRDFDARLRRLAGIPSQTIFVDGIENDIISVRVCVEENVVSTFIDVKISPAGKMKIVRIEYEAE